MKRNILLTCGGGNIFYEFLTDFQKREDMELFVSDVDPHSRARFLSDNFIHVLPADDKEFSSDLLEKAKRKDIKLIIPGADEEAFALMKHRKIFEENGIIVTVQDISFLDIFRSKSSVYEYLKNKGFEVPLYEKVKTGKSFHNALTKFDYPKNALLVKPNSSRGGKGITILSEKAFQSRDNLPLMDKQLFTGLLDGASEFLLMPYIDGTVYDIDALKYKSGRRYFGIRKRFNNVTKLFSGNYFESNNEIAAFSEKLYSVIPTEYLVDYDFMVADDGKIHLLEINPRPSGSTISYLPFGINMYYILAKSYLDDEDIEIDNSFYGYHSRVFYKMAKGKL